MPTNDQGALADAIRLVKSDSKATADRAAHALEGLRTELSATLWRERYDAVYQSCMCADVMVPA